jgi:hypothetical protein
VKPTFGEPGELLLLAVGATVAAVPVLRSYAATRHPLAQTASE